MKRIFLGVILAFGVSCGTDKGAHLPPEKMEKVLLDIQLAEVYGSIAGVDSAYNPGIRSNDSLIVYYREVLAHHNITLKDFKQSLEWYRNHPDKLDTVYVRALNQLSKDEQLKLK